MNAKCSLFNWDWFTQAFSYGQQTTEIIKIKHTNCFQQTFSLCIVNILIVLVESVFTYCVSCCPPLCSIISKQIEWVIKAWLLLFPPELKKNDLFPSSCQTHLTPGPPKKKQKIRHHDNNHQPNHTLHQTPYNHKPSRTHIFFNDNYELKGLAPKVNKYKQQESPGSVKPWKPKRPVPTSRDTPSKLILDEADDFPRGSGKAENTEMKKKKRKTKKPKQVSSVPPEGHRDRRPHPPSCADKGKRKRKDRKWRTANNKHDAQMYPSDENLFIIKQRRRSR